MDFAPKVNEVGKTELLKLTEHWGSQDAVTLYLDRCQVDTPTDIVSSVWSQITSRRQSPGHVVDFGAGDARFSKGGKYKSYVGYEIDAERSKNLTLPYNAQILNRCAFSDCITDADIALGNPPYVRNQDLPSGWREAAASVLDKRAGVSISGLANAWQYFFLLSLISTKPDGLVVLVLPFEWVSRPSVTAMRQFIKNNKWGVSVYRLKDDTFSRVLTTASITVVDKSRNDGQWQYFRQLKSGEFRQMPSPTAVKGGFVGYATRRSTYTKSVKAVRGLSPGTQAVLTLTEAERIRHGLKIGSDVVRCITTLRPISDARMRLTKAAFRKLFILSGAKCWLIRTDVTASKRLQKYLRQVPESARQTSTCLDREKWWKFSMPSPPAVLIATGFRGAFPKVVTNDISVRAIGSVAGIFGPPKGEALSLVRKLRTLNVSHNVVHHSHGLRKLEINQINTLLSSVEAL